MPYTPSSHTPYQWQDAPATGTPLDSAHLEAAETDLVAYTQQQIEALDSYLEQLLAPLNSPALTGTPSAPTAPAGTSSTQIATTQFVQTAIAGVSGTGGALVPTGVKTAAYTANAFDFVPCDTSGGALTITLPNAPADQTRVGVLIVNGSSTVTISTQGGATFDIVGGSSSRSLSVPFQGTVLQYSASTGIWYETSSNLGLAQLDSRYAPLASPAFTGAPTAPTPANADNSTKLATTAFVASNSVSLATSSGGANAGSYGRSSTISAPTLRDFVTILDFVPAGDPNNNGNGSTDDSTVVQAAYTALANAGGGTLFFTQHRLNGTSSATWTYQRIASSTASRITVHMYSSVHQPVSASSGGSMWKGDGNSANAGQYLTSDVRFFGGQVHGIGTEALNQAFVFIARGKDVTLRDIYVQNWAANAAGGCPFDICGQRIRVEDCSLINCCYTGSQNPITFSMGHAFNGNTVPLWDWIITGCIVQGSGAAPIGVSYGSPADQPLAVFYVTGNPTGGQTQLVFTWQGTTYTSAAITVGMTASQIATAIQNSTGGTLPTGVSVYADTNMAENTSATLPGIWEPNNASGGGAINPVYFFVVFTGLAATGGTNSLLTGLSTIDAWTGGNSPSSVWQTPRLRLLICDNPDLESTGWSAVVFEQGGATNTSAVPMIQGTIENNVLRYTGNNTGSQYALAITNDSSPLITSSILFQYLIIANNQLESNRHGMLWQGSNGILRGNIVNAYYHGMILGNAPGGGTNITATSTQLHGGQVNLADGSGGYGIYASGCTDLDIDGPAILCPTGSTGSATGVYLGSCTRADIRVKVRNMPSRGIWISGGADIHIHSGTRISNPSQNATTSGIRVDGTLTGNVHIHDGVTVTDTSAKMTYALDTSSATLGSNTVFFKLGPHVQAGTSGIVNGTASTATDQYGLASTSASRTMSTWDSGAYVTATGTTQTLPAHPALGAIYRVILSVAGTVTIATGTTGKILNVNATSESLATQWATYAYQTIDGTNWVRVQSG